jgi:MFS family permease
VAGPTRVEPTAEVLGRATGAVVATFAISGFMFASWAARIPAVRDSLDVTPDRLGLILLAGATGSLVGLPLSGMVVERFGSRFAVLTFATLAAAGLVVAAVGVSVAAIPVVVGGGVLSGLGNGVWDAAMNLEGGAVERLRSRSLMPRFHASFSIGTMAGAGVGALAARLGVPLAPHLVAVALASVAGVVVAVRAFLPDGGLGATEVHSSTSSRSHRRRAIDAWLEWRTLMIGLIVLAAALTEGAANDWLSVAVVDGFKRVDAVGALSFGLFVTAMTGMRLAGTVLLDRFGRVAVLRLVAVLALVFPVGMSAASDDPALAPMRISVVSTIGYAAFLAGPPLLGFLAAHVGYRHALLAIVVPVVLSLAVVHAAAPPEAPRTSAAAT